MAPSRHVGLGWGGVQAGRRCGLTHRHWLAQCQVFCTQHSTAQHSHPCLRVRLLWKQAVVVEVCLSACFHARGAASQPQSAGWRGVRKNGIERGAGIEAARYWSLGLGRPSQAGRSSRLRKHRQASRHRHGQVAHHMPRPGRRAGQAWRQCWRHAGSPPECRGRCRTRLGRGVSTTLPGSCPHERQGELS